MLVEISLLLYNIVIQYIFLILRTSSYPSSAFLTVRLRFRFPIDTNVITRAFKGDIRNKIERDNKEL